MAEFTYQIFLVVVTMASVLMSIFAAGATYVLVLSPGGPNPGQRDHPDASHQDTPHRHAA